MYNLTKKNIYDKVCGVLTEFDDPEEYALTNEQVAQDMAHVLFIVQSNWEEVITAQE